MKERKEGIINGGTHQYLGDFMEDLPNNVILNKVITGCGMTSVVLSNEVKYVLVVPFVALIENKMKWCEEKGIEVLAIYSSGAKQADIATFSGNKIITTYDSLKKVTAALKQRGDIKDWKVCIDEAHKLIDSGSFRGRAIRGVLNNYKEYGAYVFGTATPVCDKYLPPELRKIPKVRLQWDELEKVTINYCQYEKHIESVATLIIIKFLNGEESGNAHIFLNSITSICTIIKILEKAGYNDANKIRLVCANNERNFNHIQHKLSGRYGLSNVNSIVRKINFYTATAFEGCDIYDEDGKVFVITDGQKDHTKIDIATVLPQIIGRIRDSYNKNIVNLLFTNCKYLTDMTEEEFEQHIKYELEEANKDIDMYMARGINARVTKDFIKNNNHPFIIYEDGILQLNEAAKYQEMHSYKTLKQTYYVHKNTSRNIIKDGTKDINGISYQYEGINRLELKGINKLRLGQKPSFRDLCLQYIDALEAPNGFFTEVALIDEINRAEPLIAKAYTQLGIEKMKAMRYRKSAIKKKLLLQSNILSLDHKVIECLNLQHGKFYSNKFIKEKLQKGFDLLGIKKRATASDIYDYYYVEQKVKKTNGKSQRGYIIKGSKIKIS